MGPDRREGWSAKDDEACGEEQGVPHESPPFTAQVRDHRDKVCHLRVAEFRTGVKETVTLLGKSKTRVKAVWQTMFEGQRDRAHSPGETHFHGVGNWPPRLHQHSHDLRSLLSG